MDHVAIMSAKTPFLARVASGEKTIESRWYQQKRAPWGLVKVGDTVYFKNSGQLVSHKAAVANVEQYADLSESEVARLIDLHASALGLHRSEVAAFIGQQSHKRYAIFIYLQAVTVVVPFKINKAGFGAMSAWISVENISLLRD